MKSFLNNWWVVKPNCLSFYGPGIFWGNYNLWTLLNIPHEKYKFIWSNSIYLTFSKVYLVTLALQHSTMALDWLNLCWWKPYTTPNCGISGVRMVPNTAENTLISWCGNFVKRHSFRIVPCKSLETMRKLCLSTKLPHQEIRWNYGIFCSEMPPFWFN